MLGELNAGEIEQVLMHQLVGRIGCHADDTTYVVPVSYAYDGKYIYVRTFEGMKVNIMRKNPKVCFQVENMNNMADWQSVIAWGIYEELIDNADRNEALQKLNDRRLPLISSETTHLSRLWPFIPQDMDEIEGIVFRIRLIEKTGRFERITVVSDLAT